MTDQLFKKAVTLTDVHFGRAGNSLQANLDNLDFIDWFIEEAKTWGAETCIMMGDWHDNRHNLNILTLDYSRTAIERLNEAFQTVYWIPGNHDLFYRDKREVSSITFAQYLPNIKIIGKPTNIGGVTLLPWLVGNEAKTLKYAGARYAFGHLEMGGFMMNAKVEMPESDHTVKVSAFDQLDYCFSGHFHIRQQKGRVVYTGNTMPFNFSDAWDEDRGMMFLEWGKDPVFKAWPDQPTFRTMTLTELLEAPKKMLKPKLTARVAIDIPITYEEVQIIKDTFVTDYQLRKVELSNATNSVDENSFSGEIIFQSTDQIVVEGLMSIQSIGFRNDKLIDIYRLLGNM